MNWVQPQYENPNTCIIVKHINHTQAILETNRYLKISNDFHLIKNGKQDHI
jgi:hypothetical protein